MIKKFVSALLGAAMLVSVLGACGGNTTSSTASTGEASGTTSGTSQSSGAEASDTG